jgi:hypothetical protein
MTKVIRCRPDVADKHPRLMAFGLMLFFDRV